MKGIIQLVFMLTLHCCVQSQSDTSAALQTNKGADEIILRLDQADNNYVFIGAHRGDWRNAPENSLQAIENCITLGLDIVEIDVRKSKDGHLVVIHDKTLDRTTTGKGNVEEYTLNELKQLFLVNPHGVATHHRIPSLEEAMQLSKGKILVFIDKSDDYLDDIFYILRKTGTMQQAIVLGRQALLSQNVENLYGSTLDSIIYIPVIDDNTPNIPQYLNDISSDLNLKAVAVWFTTENGPSFRAIDQIEELNHLVLVSSLWPEMCAGHHDDFAVKDPDASWGWLVEHGADIIITDRPVLLTEYLRLKGLHN